jgi:transposase
MDKKELRKLSKNQLIEIILRLEDRLMKLEQLVRAFDNPHTPSSKVRSKENTERDESSPRFPGKPKGGNGGGVCIPKPDREERITKEHCPSCGKGLGKCVDAYRFRQMDIPQPQFTTTLYTVEIYSCPCGAEIDAGADMQKGFYGPNTSALIGYLKKEGLSHQSIAQFFGEVYNLPISSVGIYGKMNHLTNNLAHLRESISSHLNGGPFIHLDETGFREDGQNGFVWVACNSDSCIFHYDKTRAAKVAKSLLSGFDGAIITDDYKGYLWHPMRQLCWSHLLREAKEVAEKRNGAETQYSRLKALYAKTKQVQESHDSSQYDDLAQELEDIASCYHPLDGCKAMYAKIHNRTSLWLLGAKDTSIPLTNNHGERCLRKVVLQRNRIGCIRNKTGERFINIFLSCTSTWKLQGKNTFQELQKISS